jgi:hypothetical protein
MEATRKPKRDHLDDLLLPPCTSISGLVALCAAMIHRIIDHDNKNLHQDPDLDFAVLMVDFAFIST